MSEFSDTLHAELDAVMQESGRATPHEVVVAMRTRHPDLVAAEADALVAQAMVRQVKGMAREEADQEQMELFGFAKLLTVPLPDGSFQMVRYDLATLDDLEAQGALKTQNAVQAQAKADAYWESVAVVRPYMKQGATLGEALHVMGAKDVSE